MQLLRQAPQSVGPLTRKTLRRTLCLLSRFIPLNMLIRFATLTFRLQSSQTARLMLTRLLVLASHRKLPKICSKGHLLEVCELRDPISVGKGACESLIKQEPSITSLRPYDCVVSRNEATVRGYSRIDQPRNMSKQFVVSSQLRQSAEERHNP